MTRPKAGAVIGRPRKLTDAMVQDIRSYLQAHKWSGAISAIARKYRICHSTASRIALGTYNRKDPEGLTGDKMREGIQTDHEFEPSPFCDCDSCNEVCHYHYGQDDACILERHMHTAEGLTGEEK